VDRDLSAVARAGPPWDDGAEGVRPTIRTTELPTLDAHVDPARAPEELRRSGAVLAMTLSLSLDEAAAVVDRPAPLVAWGVGCHPRRSKAQAAFDASRFASSRRGRRSSGRSGSTRDGRAFPSRTSCGRSAMPSTSSAGSLGSRASTATPRPRSCSRSCDKGRSPRRSYTGGRARRPRRVRPWRWGAPSRSTRRWRASPSSEPPSRPNASSSRPTTAGPIRRPPFPAASSGLSTSWRSSSPPPSRTCVVSSGGTWRGSSATRARSTSCLLPCGRFCAPVRTVKSDLARDGRRDPSGRAGGGLGVPLPGGASMGLLEDAAGSPRRLGAAWALNPR